MIVKKECLYQGTIKGSDIDTFCTWIQKRRDSTLRICIWRKENSDRDARIMLQNIVKKVRKNVTKT